MAKKASAETVITCGKCGHETRGPDAADVKATHERHLKKAGHKK